MDSWLASGLFFFQKKTFLFDQTGVESRDGVGRIWTFREMPLPL